MNNHTTVTGVILAGGQGRRMGGEDKGMTALNGIPLFNYVLNTLRQQVSHVVISANRNILRYQQDGITVIPDSLPDYQGPLAGMLSVMDKIDSPWFLFCPCDTPYIPNDLLSQLWLGKKNHRICWVNDGQRDHPTISLIHASQREPLRDYLHRGDRRILHFFKEMKGQPVLFPRPSDFININSPSDLHQAREKSQ